MANGERKLRDRTRTVEHKRVATIFGCEFRRQLGEFFREKSRIMRDHDSWFRRNSLLPVPIVQIGDKSARCAVDIEKIHCVRADAWKLGPLVLACVAAFCSRNDFPDGPPAQATGAEGKRLIKPIV